jgi:trans-aconitate methyltransferase
MTKPRDWDAAEYERLSAPIAAMGRDVLDRLVLAGDETALDAGCGTGKVTRALRDRLPQGRVIAVDASASMVEQARAQLRGTCAAAGGAARAVPAGGARPARAARGHPLRAAEHPRAASAWALKLRQ